MSHSSFQRTYKYNRNTVPPNRTSFCSLYLSFLLQVPPQYDEPVTKLNASISVNQNFGAKVSETLTYFTWDDLLRIKNIFAFSFDFFFTPNSKFSSFLSARKNISAQFQVFNVLSRLYNIFQESRIQNLKQLSLRKEKVVGCKLATQTFSVYPILIQKRNVQRRVSVQFCSIKIN